MATDKKETAKAKSGFDSEMGIVLFLVVIIVIVPLAITIMDIGAPIKGYNS